MIWIQQRPISCRFKEWFQYIVHCRIPSLPTGSTQYGICSSMWGTVQSGIWVPIQRDSTLQNEERNSYFALSTANLNLSHNLGVETAVSFSIIYLTLTSPLWFKYIRGIVCGDRSNRNERLDIVTWCSVFDFIPCPRDVFDGLSCFVWWTALCVASGYAIC